MLYSERITNKPKCKKSAFRKESIMWVLSKNICSAREGLTCFYAANTAFFSTLISFGVFQSKQECLKQASNARVFPQKKAQTKSKSCL